jgi:L-fuconolactonase
MTNSHAWRIDAHQHFWLLAARGGDWPPPELAAIYRDFLPPDLEGLLAEAGVGRTVLVQSLPSEDDTRFMLGLAERHPFIAAVVGWADLKSPEAPQRIAALAAHPRLKGLRPMLQGLEPEWLDDETLAPAVQAMLEHQLVFDALVLPRHLPALLRFARRYPQLPIVIDHCAKPLIASALLDPWREDMAALAALPQVVCKLSGMVTEAAPDWKLEDLRAYAAHVLEIFGPRRVLWGSDWPVLNLASDYAGWRRTTDALLDHLDEEARAAIYAGNAERVYRLDGALASHAPAPNHS